MKRCDHCNGKLGLGVISKRYWQRASFFWQTYRFCSTKCRDAFDQARVKALARERAALRLFQVMHHLLSVPALVNF